MTWGTLLLLSDTPLQTIALYGIVRYAPLPSPLLALLFYAVSACAILSLYASTILWRIGGLIPQQFLLVLSAASAIEFILRGQTTDGSPRPWAFLAAAQAPTILLACFHSYSLCTIFTHQSEGR